jgi:hypothetical protein
VRIISDECGRGQGKRTLCEIIYSKAIVVGRWFRTDAVGLSVWQCYNDTTRSSDGARAVNSAIEE